MLDQAQGPTMKILLSVLVGMAFSILLVDELAASPPDVVCTTEKKLYIWNASGDVDRSGFGAGTSPATPVQYRIKSGKLYILDPDGPAGEYYYGSLTDTGTGTRFISGSSGDLTIMFFRQPPNYRRATITVVNETATTIRWIRCGPAAQ